MRIGSVPDLVGRPLDSGLEHASGLVYRRAVPAALVDDLRSDALDVALVSSIELFRRPGYRYVDELAVAGRGSVRSVQLFLRVPLERVGTIALDPASRTSAVLVEIELAARFGRRPELVELPASADPSTAATDAWLQIGDAALRTALAPSAPPSFNPSRAWTERTGLPFVFACWVAAPHAPVDAHLAEFAAARARGRARTAELAREAALEWNLPAAACREYIEHECVYELGSDEMRRALFAFRDAAAALGRCDASLSPAALPIGAARR
jgi:chorismate dehydratase